jgi:hypothetical protein
MPGYNAGLYTYDYPGNPTGADVEAFNPPLPALVWDTDTPALWFKTSPLNDNTGYVQVIAGTSPGAPVTTDVTPTTGNTIDMNANGQSEFIYITPAGTLATLIIVFPADATSKIGQVESICSTQIITALTLTANSNTILGAALTAMVANTVYSWRKVAASTWQRVQ